MNLSENSAFALCLCLVISLTYEEQVYELEQLKQLFKVKHEYLWWSTVSQHDEIKVPQTQ